jgi:regulator of cell morphogenesis and NO signaling
MAGDTQWDGASLRQLVTHILETHHAFTRREIARLAPMLDAQARAQGTSFPALGAIRTTFLALAEELGPHLLKEERILFPYIEDLDGAAGSQAPPPFGTVRNPVQMMLVEHEHAEDLLRALREQTNGYAPPAGADDALRAVFAGLAAFDRDLTEHMRLESEVLFPRAIAAE